MCTLLNPLAVHGDRDLPGTFRPTGMSAACGLLFGSAAEGGPCDTEAPSRIKGAAHVLEGAEFLKAQNITYSQNKTVIGRFFLEGA